ncbi:MAG: hypothetical protein A2W98_13360 [Bacteroidetes bacterium GWF2_33_38]|nr:MAG: hypothetical protein A2W98_13360 [Bacteroidetes bacterium GWF2_33_38]OFY73877.1 MAG: hypothetical protein A2265_02605 [Bacteroidetes bacterium RIFOXYA12_FULL_33_9]
MNTEKEKLKYLDRFKRNEICIIDLVDESDTTSISKQLAESSMKYFSFSVDGGFDITINKINNKGDLIKYFDKLQESVNNFEVNPWIHIEAHGNTDGVKIGSSDFITWEELLDLLREINIKLLNTLIVVLSMCYGVFAAIKVDFSKRAPFNLLAGIDREVSYGESFIAFETFYNEFRSGKQLLEAIKIVNTQIKGQMILKPIDYFFNLYTNLDEPLDNQIQKVIDDEALTRTYQMKGKLDSVVFYKMKVIIEKDIRDKMSKLSETKEWFLMNDLIEKTI